MALLFIATPDMATSMLHALVVAYISLSLSVSLSLCVCVCVCVCLTLSPLSLSRQDWKSHVGTAARHILFVSFLWGVTPVLQTLTNALSDDAVWVMTIISMLIHLFFHEYRQNVPDTRFTWTLSLNAAIFASVLLSSRLRTQVQVFALVYMAIELFAGLPLLRKMIRRSFFELHVFITWVLFCIATAMLMPVSNILAISYLATMFVLVIVCPAFLLYIWEFKNEIHGPWDEAKPLVRGS
eukprot:TRINITY_DN5863_c0_g1_i1.p1 TRINITY_DN5863_c0_g1~~TRINITY_DN5863_c0_g1_i1.p1  ORF type:complete len:239 (+),score=16.41 TRINITY_DN5863_c0_g1_i1:476-1192(+)